VSTPLSWPRVLPLYEAGEHGPPVTGMNAKGALAFVRRYGLVLESAHGPVPNLAEAVAGAPIRGSWWGHARGQEIFSLTRAVRSSPDVLVCRLVRHKLTYINRRLWPALTRLARHFDPDDLAALQEVHMARGEHAMRVLPFPRWVPSAVRRKARTLTEVQAKTALVAAWPCSRMTYAPVRAAKMMTATVRVSLRGECINRSRKR
jgi:hypothetical protein